MARLIALALVLIVAPQSIPQPLSDLVPITEIRPLAEELSVEVEEPPLIPAPGAQRDPAIAGAGDSLLAVWADRRYGQFDIFATRLDREGRALDPEGIPIAPSWADDLAPDLVWTGSGYFVVWHARPGIFFATIGKEGFVTGSSLVHSARETVVSDSAVAWDGGQILVLWVQQGLSENPNDRVTRVFGRFMDETGKFVSDSFIIRHAELDATITSPDVESTGEGFVATWEERIGGLRRVVAVGIGPSGSPSDPIVLGEAPRPGESCFFSDCRSTPELAHGSEDYLLVWSDGRVRAQRVGRDGQPVGESTTLSHPEMYALMPSVSRSTEDWTISWSQAPLETLGDSLSGSLDLSLLDLVLVSLDGDLDVIEGSQVQFDVPGTQADSALTSTGGRSYAVWSDLRNAPSFANFPLCCGAGDVFALVVDDWKAHHLISNGRANQFGPVIEALDGTVLAVWHSQIDDDEYEIRFRRFDGSGRPLGTSRTIPGSVTRGVTSASLSSSRTQFLLAWLRHLPSAPQAVAVRIADGEVLESEPLPIGRARSVAVASDGSSFLVTGSRETAEPDVVYPTPSEIFDSIVTPDGTALPAQTIASHDVRGAQTVGVTWNGSEYFVAWTERAGASTRIQGRFVSSAGMPLGEAPVPIAGFAKYRPALSSVSSNDRYQLITGGVTSGSDGWALGYLVSSDGRIVPDTEEAWMGVGGSFSVWDGQRFVLSFHPLAALRAGRVALVLTEEVPMLPLSHGGGVRRVYLQMVPYAGRERAVRRSGD